MDHLAVDDAIAAPVTTASCRTSRPPLDLDGAIAMPITTPSSPCSIPQQHPTGGIVPASSTSHGVHRVTTVSDRQGSDTKCWRRLTQRRFFFFYLGGCLSQLTIGIGKFPME
uniref:Uncharacterized protein n=1 Tax=Aegilops tauschii TaxID=37682 RepID=M8CFL1_AEGTA